MVYSLSCILKGHTADVRCLAVGPDGTIVSGSRDQTTIIWKPADGQYKLHRTVYGHINYVSAVCFLSPTIKHPSGIIITGSHDSTIRVYRPESIEPIQIIEGHNGAVSHLCAADENRFLSSSWDKTVKLWYTDTDDGVVTFKGHLLAVWCAVYVPDDLVVTGCADKAIRIYKSNGIFQRALSGHNDCIRGLCYIKNGILLSCANDASVKRWDIFKGVCLETMYGHPSYIYSIACGNEGDLIVTGGEDRCVRVWSSNNTEYITIPAQSIWTVAILPNTDIVVGSSDGIIRVFSCEESRMANEKDLFAYAKEVSKSNLENMNEVGGIKIAELPGKDILNECGKYDGHIRMVREDNTAICYRWSEIRTEWQRVGDIVGACGGTPQTSGKVLHEGMEYDYVFNVDLEDGKPPLKLPYNTNEDPWMVAQKFITKYEIEQGYLSQIANFIISNSAVQSTEIVDSNNMLVDPLTGTSRHIPYSHAVQSDSVQPPDEDMFPQTKYVRFDHANIKLIGNKLMELNNKIGAGFHHYDPMILDNVVNLAEAGPNPNEIAIHALRELFLWPEDIIFPVLDIARLAVRSPEINTQLCTLESGTFLLSVLLPFLLTDARPPNKMLTMKLLSNMFCNSAGEELNLTCYGFVLPAITRLAYEDAASKSHQVAITTLLLNYAVAFVRRRDDLGQKMCRAAAYEIIPLLIDSEALLRGVVALGTMIHALDRPIVPQHIFIFLKNTVSERKLEKIGKCCHGILDMIRRRTKRKNYNN